MKNPEDEYQPEVKCRKCKSTNTHIMPSKTTNKSYYYKCETCKHQFAVLK